MEAVLGIGQRSDKLATGGIAASGGQQLSAKLPVGLVITIDGVPRTFRDRRQDANDAAYLLKQKNRNSIVEIIDESTGQKVIMLEDGRTN